MRRRAGRLLDRALTVTAVVLLSLAVAELALRLYHLVRPSYVLAAVSRQQVRGRPHGANYDGRLNSRGFNDVDLLPPFVEAGRSRRLYKPRDSHWNIAGNELAAERLRAWLLSPESGLALPDGPSAGAGR